MKTRRNVQVPDDLQFKIINSVADLPTENKVYWCRLRDGYVTKIVWHNGNWRTWKRFRHPDTGPLEQSIVAYAPHVSCRKTPEEYRETARKLAKERREERQKEHEAWIAAGRPQPQLLKRR
jgi:muconolactone delta-isomerase